MGNALLRLTKPITLWLRRWRSGDGVAATSVATTMNDMLRRAAVKALRDNPPAGGMGVTQLLHETWARISARAARPFHNREHLMGVAILAMRGVLVDKFRAAPAPDLDKLPPAEPRPGVRTAELDARLALETLKTEHPRQARAFVQAVMGVSHAEIARDIGTSESTVREDLRFAKAYLKSRLSD